MNRQSVEVALKSPVFVPEAERPQFEQDLATLLFGRDDFQGFDEVREELLTELREHGADPEQLHALARPRNLRLCPPGQRQFRISRRLNEAFAAAGVDPLGHGMVSLHVYYGDQPDTSKGLPVTIRLPQSLASLVASDPGLEADLATALFGHCCLHPDVEAYLAALGIELHAISKEVFGDRTTPPTARIDSGTARRLAQFDIDTRKYGRFNVTIEAQA